MSIQERFEQTLLDFQDSIDGCYDRMRQAEEDLKFAYVPGCQWDGSDAKTYQNRPKFENNTTAIAIQRIHGQYQRSEFGLTVIPLSDDATEEDAEILTSRYRNDVLASDGIEADSNAALEAFTCGFGASLLSQEYEDEERKDANYQVLCFEPIYSACTSVVFSANALRKDKSDAKRCWYLVRANRKSIEEKYNTTISPYPQSIGEHFDWYTDSTKDIYIAHVWEVIEKTFIDYIFPSMQLVITKGDGLKDQHGNDIEKKVLDDLMVMEDYDTNKRVEKVIEYSLQHGDGYLVKPKKTAFKRIPIIPRYGHYVVINGIEHWFGEVALKRDPQRFGNMLYSALGQIAAQNQVAVPEYLPSQVARHATAFQEKDIENPPYLLTDAAELPDGSAKIGPHAMHEPPNIGSGLSSALQMNTAIKQEQEGVGQSTVPANTSAQAVQMVNERGDDRYQALFQNQMFAIQAGARVYIPAAQKLYFSNPRQLGLLHSDGVTRSRVKTMQPGPNADNTQYGLFKYAAKGKFGVHVKMDEAYRDKKTRQFQEAMQMMQYADSQTPEGKMIMNQAILSTTSEASKDIRRLVRFNNIDILLARQIPIKPENEEEAQYIQRKMQEMEAAKNQPPKLTPEQEALIEQAKKEGEARLMEGQAALQNEVNDATKNEIALMKIHNDQQDLKIRAKEAGATIQLKDAQSLKAKADAAASLAKKTAEQ